MEKWKWLISGSQSAGGSKEASGRVGRLGLGG